MCRGGGRTNRYSSFLKPASSLQARKSGVLFTVYAYFIRIVANVCHMCAVTQTKIATKNRSIFCLLMNRANICQMPALFLCPQATCSASSIEINMQCGSYLVHTHCFISYQTKQKNTEKQEKKQRRMREKSGRNERKSHGAHMGSANHPIQRQSRGQMLS